MSKIRIPTPTTRMNEKCLRILASIGEKYPERAFVEMIERDGKSLRRTQRVVDLREACAYYLHEQGMFSYTEIAGLMGFQYHSAINYASLKYRKKIRKGDVKLIQDIFSEQTNATRTPKKTKAGKIEDICLETLADLGFKDNKFYLTEIIKERRRSSGERDFIPPVRQTLAFWLRDRNFRGKKLPYSQIARAVGYQTSAEAEQAIVEHAKKVDRMMKETKEVTNLARRSFKLADQRAIKKIMAKFPEEAELVLV